jgi:2-methylisocitrate lyase-like PEP mutase family enzyme
MIIYANQTLRVAHASISKILKQLKNSSSISDISEDLSSMEEIFQLQEMYTLKKQEKEIEKNLKKMGYIS